MNIVYLCIITLFAGLTPSGQAKIDKLLSMASNYQQVEKTIMHLMHAIFNQRMSGDFLIFKEG